MYILRTWKAGVSEIHNSTKFRIIQNNLKKSIYFYLFLNIFKYFKKIVIVEFLHNPDLFCVFYFATPLYNHCSENLESVLGLIRECYSLTTGGRPDSWECLYECCLCLRSDTIQQNNDSMIRMEGTMNTCILYIVFHLIT